MGNEPHEEAPPDAYPGAHPAGGSRSVRTQFEIDLGRLSGPCRNLALALLLYKGLFVSGWFDALGREEDAATRQVFERIHAQTVRQAHEAVHLVHEWDSHHWQPEAVEATTREILTRLLDDMLSLKERCTEAFLAAGIRAPTEALRQRFLELADLDRQHADALRKALGVRLAHAHGSVAPGPGEDDGGARVGPFEAGTLSRSIQNEINRAREEGYTPSRLVVSGLVLRHLRDEGAVEPRLGTVFDLPVDIDFSWKGEVFVMLSRDRLTLAEIVTEMHRNGGLGLP